MAFKRWSPIPTANHWTRLPTIPHRTSLRPPSIPTRIWPSDFDIRQSLSAALSYNLRGARYLKALTSHWALDGVVSARSATPVDVTYSADIGYGLYNWRPDYVYGQPLYIADPNVAGDAASTRMRLNFPTRIRAVRARWDET